MPPDSVLRSRLDSALGARDLSRVRAAARAFPNGIGLADALAVLELMVEVDDPQFERAAVRWIARFAGECGGVALGEVHAALEALDVLPAPDARATLVALLGRHGVR